MRVLSILIAIALAAVPATASARDIVISNDDGLTSNVLALYHALKEDGHDVIVSVPCRNQSGQGAALRIGQPLVPLADACLNNAAQPGEPAVGPMSREGLPAGDFFYVDGTPIMALAYGLDVVAQARWGAMPDLVLSGPNEGRNVGAIVISSGTVSNAQFAALRGLSAIALSAGVNTEGDEELANPLSGEVARLSAALVRLLDDGAGEGAMLPQGLALNVNFPDDLQGARWQATRIGSYNGYRIAFTENMAENATPTMRERAATLGIALPQLPGLLFGVNNDRHLPEQRHDESVVVRSAITVSPMQSGYAHNAAGEHFVEWRLSELLAGHETAGD